MLIHRSGNDKSSYQEIPNRILEELDIERKRIIRRQELLGTETGWLCGIHNVYGEEVRSFADIMRDVQTEIESFRSMLEASVIAACKMSALVKVISISCI